MTETPAVPGDEDWRSIEDEDRSWHARLLKSRLPLLGLTSPALEPAALEVEGTDDYVRAVQVMYGQPMTASEPVVVVRSAKATARPAEPPLPEVMAEAQSVLREWAGAAPSRLGSPGSPSSATLIIQGRPIACESYREPGWWAARATAEVQDAELGATQIIATVIGRGLAPAELALDQLSSLTPHLRADRALTDAIIRRARGE